MASNTKIIVVGLGEVGKPLVELVSRHHDTVGVDLAPVTVADEVAVLHVCYPFQIESFVQETARYIEWYRPALTIINSTVPIGTTRAVAQHSRTPVVNSPVRGKHAHMLDDMRRYTKFVGAINRDDADTAATHFQSVGLKTKVLSSPEATELAKLTETTYFGLMIAWAQEVERYCDRFSANYDDVVSFYEEIGFFPPVKYFPGIIGGHCVMQNIELLGKCGPSVLLDAIKASNKMRMEREAQVMKEAALV